MTRSCDGSGRGRSSRPFATENVAVTAPIPIASVRQATAAKPGASNGTKGEPQIVSERFHHLSAGDFLMQSCYIRPLGGDEPASASCSLLPPKARWPVERAQRDVAPLTAPSPATALDVSRDARAGWTYSACHCGDRHPRDGVARRTCLG